LESAGKVEEQGTNSISIVIPVYNAANYLEACLNSVLLQSFTDFEIVVIDDGSTDESLSILKGYASSDSRIKLLQQENSGPSVARNRGLATATGDLIFFLDADDTIEKESLSRLMEDFVATDADLVIGAFRKFSPDGSPIEGFVPLKSRLLGREDVVALAKSYLNEPNRYLHFAYSWGRLFKRSIINDHELCFDENLRSFEDVKFNFHYLKYCKSVFVSECNVYRFLVRDDHSSMTFSIGDDPEGLLGYNHAIGSIASYITDTNPDENISCEVATAYVSLSVIQIIRICVNTDSSNYRKIHKSLTQVVHNDQIISSLKIYRAKKGQSRLIPILMKYQLVYLLMLACTIRGRKRYGKKL
jgi:glycosyltransferase involved in cell wall biosynthesis